MLPKAFHIRVKPEHSAFVAGRLSDFTNQDGTQYTKTKYIQYLIEQDMKGFNQVYDEVEKMTDEIESLNNKVDKLIDVMIENNKLIDRVIQNNFD